MKYLIGYCEDMMDDNGFDNVWFHPDIEKLQFNCDNSIIYKMIEDIHFTPKTELQKIYQIQNFDEIYWFLLDNQFVDIMDEEIIQAGEEGELYQYLTDDERNKLN